MKKLFIALFFLVSISTIFKPEHAFSNTEDKGISSTDDQGISSSRRNIYLEDLFDFDAWTGDEKSLDLEIPLPEGMQFPQTYPFIIWENTIQCEINFDLLKGHHIVSSEGFPFDKVVMLVKVKNVDDQVVYKITVKASWAGIDEDGDSVTYYERIIYSGQIFCPPVDVTQGFEVYSYEDEDVGVISFRHVLEPVL
jgi:hypothetical protein